jgi:hypothetical protein
MEKGLCEKSIRPSSSFHFIHREIDDPAELEAILLYQPKLVADLDARPAQRRQQTLSVARRRRTQRHRRRG